MKDKKAKVSRQTLYDWKKGKIIPTHKKLKELKDSGVEVKGFANIAINRYKELLKD